MIGPMISLVAQLTAISLFLSGALCFVILFKGCYVLRRHARGRSRDESILLLKSPQVPMVSVVAVARDGSAESRSFVRRLLDLHFSSHQVVLVLDGHSELEFEKWTAEFRLIAPNRGTWESAAPLLFVVARTEQVGVAAAHNSGVA